MIAVTFALPAESSGFVRLIEDGRLYGREVQIVHTGVGERIARTRVESFLGKMTPRLLISAGFAGALSDQLRVGDLFIAENFSAPEFTTLARDLGVTGKLHTVYEIADSSEKRAELARTSGALAVDMETAAIASACARHGITMLSLRAISDTPAAPFSIPSRVLFDLEKQRTRFTTLGGYLVRHPGSVARLLTIARQAKTARRSLTSALDQLLQRLPGS